MNFEQEIAACFKGRTELQGMLQGGLQHCHVAYACLNLSQVEGAFGDSDQFSRISTLCHDITEHASSIATHAPAQAKACIA